MLTMPTARCEGPCQILAPTMLAWHDKKQPEPQDIHGIDTASKIVVNLDKRSVYQSNDLTRASRRHGPPPLDLNQCLICKPFLKQQPGYAFPNRQPNPMGPRFHRNHRLRRPHVLSRACCPLARPTKSKEARTWCVKAP